MNTGIEFTMKLSAAYSAVCRPLCHELNLPQTAFDILMFLANNPEYTTARDIVEVRKIKANLVSINVDNRGAHFRTALWTVFWRTSTTLPESSSQKVFTRWSRIWITC